MLYDICILICILGVTRHEAQQWCLAHGFELVELNPLELPDEDGESAGCRNEFDWTQNKDCHSFSFCLFQMTSQNPQE